VVSSIGNAISGAWSYITSDQPAVPNSNTNSSGGMNSGASGSSGSSGTSGSSSASGSNGSNQYDEGTPLNDEEARKRDEGRTWVDTEETVHLPPLEVCADSDSDRNVSQYQPNNDYVSYSATPFVVVDSGAFYWRCTFVSNRPGVFLQKITIVVNMNNADGSRVVNRDGLPGDFAITYWEALEVGYDGCATSFVDTFLQGQGWSEDASGTNTTIGLLQFYPDAHYSDFPGMGPENVSFANNMYSSFSQPVFWTDSGAIPNNAFVNTYVGGSSMSFVYGSIGSATY
jgi:hypothetical protein